MCLILVAWRVHPDFPLVVAANRDEFFMRPTTAAAWWQENNSVLAGRDLQGGGTWLGVTRQGRFAALTNYRDPQAQVPTAPSRGRLVSSFLTAEGALADNLAQVARRGTWCNGYSFLGCDGQQLGLCSSSDPAPRLLEPGIYGLSNHLLDTPWPKVREAKQRMTAALQALPDNEQLLDLLLDDRPAADAELPATGVSLELERSLSSAFVRAPGYGTRSSTLVLVSADGDVAFDEWTWEPDGALAGLARQRFALAR